MESINETEVMMITDETSAVEELKEVKLFRNLPRLCF